MAGVVQMDLTGSDDFPLPVDFLQLQVAESSFGLLGLDD